jgi:hypothetical protein
MSYILFKTLAQSSQENPSVLACIIFRPPRASPMDLTFKEPIVACVQGPRGEPALLEIKSVRDGLAAVNRHGLGDHRYNSIEWQRAVDRLVKAALNPSSECVEEARQALLELVNRVR